MKKSLLYGFLALGSMSIAQESNFLNSGFEDWTSKTFTYPDTLESTTRQYLQYRSDMDTVVIEKSNDAYEGSHSIKISCKITENGDTLNGYTLLGDWGDNGPSGGAPYTFQADSFSLMYKADLQPNDTAWAIFQLKKNGSLIGGGQYPITESSSTWKEFTAPNPAGLVQAPDSIFFAFIATNGLQDEANAKPGSWVQLDRVGMKKMNGDFEPISNGGFENWTDSTIHSPNNWYSINSERTMDANSGTYAVELTTTSRTDGDGDLDTSSGYLTNYNLVDYDQHGGTHYVQQATALKVWVDYSPVNGDSARIDVQFYQDKSWVAGDAYYVKSNTGGYSEITIPLGFSQDPDTVRLNITSGDNPGSVIKVDDIELSTEPTSTNEVSVAKLNIYPNPSSDFITFSSKAESFNIYNVLGKELKTSQIFNTNSTVDVSNFQSGIYFLTAFNSNNETIDTKQFTVK